MWKTLAIFAVVTVISAGTQKPLPMNRGCQQEHPQPNTDIGQPPAPSCASEVCKENTENAERYAYYKAHPKEYFKTAIAPANLSNWILAALGIIGGILAVLTLRTFKRQTDHIVTSERAWMIAEPGDARIPPEIEGATGIRWTEFSVRLVNKGKTPAFLLEAGYCGKVLPHGEQLPIIQPPYGEKEISKWDGKGLPLLPNADVRKDHLGVWANDPVKITRSFDVLWVYGYIKYGNAFGFVRETWYCYRWVPEIERWQVSGFIAGGPESYNYAT